MVREECDGKIRMMSKWCGVRGDSDGKVRMMSKWCGVREQYHV